MALQQAYMAYLANPSTASLAVNASIHYLPTLTTINEPTAIIKHLASQAKLLTKKSEKILNAIEGPNSLCLEMETTIEFTAGGGAFAPGLDDNFLSDRTVTFPTIHIVQFDAQGKISQLRLYWDQGSLLKQLEVIGSRGRNWPLRDGRDQLRLIATSASKPSTPEVSRRSTVSTTAGAAAGRSHASSVTSAMGDPHATLSLFQPREVLETPPKKNTGVGGGPSSISVRPSARPPTRDLTDILAGAEQELPLPDSPSKRPSSPTKTSGAARAGASKHWHDIRLFDEEPDIPKSPESVSMRPPSPRKNSGGAATAARAGASKHYHDIRLFEEEAEELKSPEKSVKTNPKKYSHFEFGHGEGAGPLKIAGRTKHQSQWDFADFDTPNKPPVKVHSLNSRHISWSDDEEDERPTVTRNVVHQARPDAKPHFAFTDDATPVADKRPGSSRRDDNMGYTDNVVLEAPAEGAAPVKQPLTTMTNVNLDSRHKDFDSQFEIQDKSPSLSKLGGTEGPSAKKVDKNLAKVLKGMNANWEMTDQSSDTESKKENYRIKTTGDGMGGRKETSRHWGFGDDEGQ